MISDRQTYRGIQDEILRRIAARVWLPGARIPDEADLALEFGAARATVNRALQELARAGLLERRRKAGTRVALHPVREARLAIPLVRREIEAAGAAYGYALVSRAVRRAPAAIAARMGLDQDTRLLHLVCVHSADGVPFQAEDRWINTAAVPAARTADFAAGGPNEWLVANAPFSRAEFAFMAESATADVARLLAVETGVAVLVAERLTWLGTQPITHVRMAHRPAYRIVSEL